MVGFEREKHGKSGEGVTSEAPARVVAIHSQLYEVVCRLTCSAVSIGRNLQTDVVLNLSRGLARILREGFGVWSAQDSRPESLGFS